MNLRRFRPFLSACLLSAAVSFADEPKRVDWVFDDTYTGSHQASFNKLRYEIPPLIRRTLINLSVRTGLGYSEGWLYPITIRFDDRAPFGTENVLAYVQLGYSAAGFEQQLVINLQAYDAENFNFEKVLAHELVHAMLNDSLGGASADLPTWFHEGLAVYGAEQGEQVLGAYVAQHSAENDNFLINGLDGPHRGYDYLEDYLAFQYIRDRHGINSLQNFIREVTSRRGDIPGSIEATCFETWDKFQENAKVYSQEQVARMSRSLRGERLSTKPY